MLMIFRQIYFTYRWDPNRYNYSSESGPGNNDNESDYTLPRAPEQKPHQKMHLLPYPGYESTYGTYFTKNVNKHCIIIAILCQTNIQN